jgi:hypothetical protein
MRTKIIKTVATGTIVSLGFAAVAFTPAAYASTSSGEPTTAHTAVGPHLAVLTDPVVQLPVRKAA